MPLCCWGAPESVQSGVDEGLKLLAAELVRIPHRIESRSLRLRKPCSRQPDKASQHCWLTLEQLLTGDEASDGLQKASLHVRDLFTRPSCSPAHENGLLSIRESTPTSDIARHHPTSDRTRGVAHGT